MCAIFGSFDKTRFQFLAEINSYRGRFSHSIAAIGTQGERLISLQQGLGGMPDEIAFPADSFVIGHCQAPTSVVEDLAQTIHPAKEGESLLWHNGILKSQTVQQLKKELRSQESWDTRLLLEFYLKGGDLGEIDGSFACVLFSGGKLDLFRNELAPLFYDPLTFDISSNYFAGSRPLPANIVWRADLARKQLKNVKAFRTRENPYYFVD